MLGLPATGGQGRGQPTHPANIRITASCVITSGLAKGQTQAQRKGQMKRDFSQAVNKGEDYLVRDSAGNDGGAGGSSKIPTPSSISNVVPGVGRALSPGVAGAWHRSRSKPQKHGWADRGSQRSGEGLQRETALGKVRLQLLA